MNEQGRRLKSQMVLKGLSLGDVSLRSGVPYNTCSLILNGRLVHPRYFSLIRSAIRTAPEFSSSTPA